MTAGDGPAKPAPRAAEGLRVIVVDDDEFVADTICRQLLMLEVGDVVAVHDGRAALRELDVRPADILVTDINMPGMDGIELLRHVASRGAPPHLVLITGENARILRTASQLAQVHGLHLLGALSKPVDIGQLEELLTRHLLEHVEAGLGGRASAPAPLELTPDDVRCGLEEDRLLPYFQPKVHARTGAVLGAEALARWAEPDGGILGPASFIPVAERAGLIKQLTRVVVDRTLAIAGSWRRDGLDVPVAVNVSVIDVEDVGFFDFMVASAIEHGVEPHSIVLEVTESRIVDRVAPALETLTRLRLRGFQLAVDDYGTGASTLEQLRRLPVDELKIDRAFVHGASSDPALRAMLASTVQLAQQLGLRTVAEGIEDTADWALVRRLGVDVVQGYAIARPRPAAEFVRWIGRVTPASTAPR